MKQYDVIIIGSGIGGLTCGAFLAKHGKNVLIVEQHHKPGGAVSSFSRKGFLFDIPSVTSSIGKQYPIGRILSELGASDNIDFIKLDRLFHFIFPDMQVNCYADTERYRAELSSLFPHERTGLDRYFKLMQKLLQETMSAPYHAGFLSYLLYPLRFPHIVRYASRHFQEVLDRYFSDHRLKAVLSGGWQYLGVGPDRLSALYMLIMYQSYLGEGTYFPKGGFQKLSDVLANAFRAKGGELRLGMLVSEIIMKDGEASGVRLASGETITAGSIVSNADTKRTFFDLVGKEHLRPRFARRIDAIEMSGSGLVVNLGIRMHVPQHFNCGTVIYHPAFDSSKNHWTAYTRGDIEVGQNKRIVSIDIRSLADETLAPAGCHAVRILDVPVPYHFQNDWKGGKGAGYERLKEHLMAGLIQAAENILPGLSQNIIVSDISTPRTYERYLRSTDGAWYDAACIPQQIGLARMPSKTLIPGLYLTGAKSFPGHGIISAMLSGVCTADLLLERQLLEGRYGFRDH